MIEGTTPYVYTQLKIARDRVFAESFHADTEDTERARIYIDEHIVHDAQEHYPDMLKALRPYERQSEGYQEVLQ